jgi:flagellar M-ring protein FliF
MALIKAESAQGFARLPVVQQIGLMVGLAVCVALGVAVALWSQKPGYSLLYGGLPDKDAAAVVDALQRSGMQYRLDANTGAIMVPAQDVRATRMKLANEGLPKSADMGLEFLENDQELGASQFV